jgi:hypothetical protein
MSKDDKQVMKTSPPKPRLRVATAEPAVAPAPFTDRAAAWLLSGPVTVALLGLCVVQLATWVPHYLTWPWFADHDVFATMALGWDRGQLPYRDLVGNNFPGTVYLFWILGKLFGWGRTVPLYALDAAFVLILGATMLAWSRGRFGRFLPGIAGYAVFLTYYLSLDFSRTAQRDWHGPFFMVVGLLLADAFPGRRSRWLSALTTAAALAIRPQTVLFVPALALAIARGVEPRPEDEGNTGSGPARTLSQIAGVLLGWGLLVALVVGLAFLPLVAAGILGDFLRGVGLTFYGARYNTVRAGSIGYQMLLQLLHLEYDLVPFAVMVLAPLSDRSTRRSAQVWLLAYLGAWIYKPLSPVPFPYLEHPLALVWAINIGLLVQLVAIPGLARPALRLVAVLLAIRLGVHARPLQCSVVYARQAITALRHGTEPLEPPLGIHIALPVEPDTLAFPWDDYRAVLEYLRTRTGPGTRVANLVHVVPALNGPSGRLTPLPAESLAWLAVKPDALPDFARALEAAPADSVVVWTPRKGAVVDLYMHEGDVERLAPVIRRRYTPAARFGAIEVWARKPQPAAARTQGSVIPVLPGASGHIALVRSHAPGILPASE